MRFAGTEYEKVRQREVDSEAHADGGDFGGPRRNKQQLDQAPDRAGIGDKAGHLRQGKAEITAECEPSAGFGRERECRIHDVRAGHGNEPRQGIGSDDRQREHVKGEREDAEIDRRIDDTHGRKADCLERDRASLPGAVELADQSTERRNHGGLD